MALVCLWAGVCLGGCAEHRMILEDPAGKPVAGARVTVYCGAASFRQDLTGADGAVCLPRRFEPPPQFVGISKEGFVPIFVAYPGQWPYVVVIRRHTPTTMPHLRR
jgi:hypothetical protein